MRPGACCVDHFSSSSSQRANEQQQLLAEKEVVVERSSFGDYDCVVALCFYLINNELLP